MAIIMVSAPFSAAMHRRSAENFEFDDALRNRILSVHQVLKSAGHEILSSHISDEFGESRWVPNFCERDLDWIAGCDAQLVLLPQDARGELLRSDGTMIELGFGHARNKPTIILADPMDGAATSFFLKAFAERVATAFVEWRPGFEDALREGLNRVICPVNRSPDTAEPREREQRSDVNKVLDDLRAETTPHYVTVDGMNLMVLPQVLSPRLSHAPDLLISKWHIPKGSCVLDLGCGCGVLGLAALKHGASRLVALDINAQAVKNTQVNLERLAMQDRGEARLSDTYAALRPGEAFDVIIFAAPYWNRPATDELAKSCYDSEHQFFRKAMQEAGKWLAPGGRMYIIFSDQGDVNMVSRFIDRSDLHVEALHVIRPTPPAVHVRIIWELSME